MIRSEDVIWRKIEDKVVIIGKDGLNTFVLNKTAARMWELCDGTKSPDEIATDICELFDVSPVEASADVRTTIEKFEQMQLLERRQDKT